MAQGNSEPVMEPVRVCFVVNAVDHTTAEVDIAVALQRYTDVEVTVLAWFEAEPFYGDALVEVVEVGAPQTTLGIDRQSLAKLDSAVADSDVIQTTHNHAGAFAKLLAFRRGIPSVSREGNTRDGFPLLGLAANGITNPLSARVVCNSRAVWNSFRGWERALLDSNDIRIIPNGVDLEAIDAGADSSWSVDRVADIDDHAVLVGTAGTLTEQKNHETLIESVALAREDGAPVELVVAGHGSRFEELQSLAAGCGVENVVHLLGGIERDAVYKLLHEIDIYAMPSLWEGFSMAAIEAAASGTACVFSDIEPFREPYADVALFHEPTDANELAAHLTELATDSSRREQLGEAGRALVEEKYTIEAVAREYRSLYAELLTESAR